MEKLKLDLEDVQVESFDVESGPEPVRGTVVGADRSVVPAYNCPRHTEDPQMCDTQYTYCDTCGWTCDTCYWCPV